MTNPDSQQRHIDYRPLSALKSDPRNPKAHDMGVIGDSVGRFGYIEPVVVDERTGYIISGHGRAAVLAGMAKKGQNPPEGVKLSPEGEWLIPVVAGWASRTDNEAAAALIALNRSTELGGWVDDSLLELLDDLEEETDGLKGIGFGSEQIDDLRAYLETVEDTVNYSVDDEGDEDEGDEEIGHIEVRAGELEVVIVIDSKDRSKLYALLETLEWVKDARDRITFS